MVGMAAPLASSDGLQAPSHRIARDKPVSVGKSCNGRDICLHLSLPLHFPYLHLLGQLLLRLARYQHFVLHVYYIRIR